MKSAPLVSLISRGRLPLLVALVIVLIGGIFLLNKADAQARDTIRKHHLEDIEQALYFARNVHGTYPPYDQSAWCGIISADGNEAVHAQIEEVLRAQNEKYANPDKPFPRDPLAGRASSEALAKEGRPQDPGPQSLSGRDVADYFYWKRTPAAFELYAVLEVDPNGERSTAGCSAAAANSYDYGLTSVWRENQ